MNQKIKEAIKTIAHELSLEYPIDTRSTYLALSNLLRGFETAIKLSITTGQDASALVEQFVIDAARSIQLALD